MPETFYMAPWNVLLRHLTVSSAPSAANQKRLLMQPVADAYADEVDTAGSLAGCRSPSGGDGSREAASKVIQEGWFRQMHTRCISCQLPGGVLLAFIWVPINCTIQHPSTDPAHG